MAKKESGQILVLAVVIAGIVLMNTLVIITGSQIFSQNANHTVFADQATNLAEAGVDKAINSLNSTGGSYDGEPETLLGLGSFSVKITTQNANTKLIESTGYVPSKANPKSKKTVKMIASKGIGASFNYGIQVGEGGLKMSENSTVNGSVYSNGDIELDNNAKITGDAYVAGGTLPTPDQSVDCTSPSCADFIFGKSVGGNSQLDVAQSFKPDSSNVLNKISLKLKKIGSPSDIAVRILTDNNGQPNKNNVIASGVLNANLASDQYGFIDIAFTSPPDLSAGTTYWMMLDTANDPSNYWAWSADSLQGYTQGKAMWSTNWQAGTPAWNLILADLAFQTYLGGVITTIDGSAGSMIGGEAHAHNLYNLDITQGAFYQTSQNITAGSYHPGSPDPASKVMPISDANISSWKNQATDAGVYTGDISSCRSQLGPGKYVGNIALSNNCTITIKDPVWITGNLTTSNGVTFKLDSSYGAFSGVIIVDGQVNFSNNVKVQGSGISGSYLMVLSTYDSRINQQEAINVSNGGVEGVLYAPVGIIEIENNNRLNEITGWKIELDNGVTINYDSGLSSSLFYSGPSGSYSLVKGTYQLK